MPPRWIDPSDVRAAGDPETVVLLPRGSLLGLYIKGVPGPVMLGIREDAQGQPVSCAVTNELFIDTSHVQSNPCRFADDDGA
jgi:hypothetical protein